ncbi:glycine--tRNA ligase subunit beta [Altererythrobacter sp. TH136]|uniref:glycine--tRNA ligase subunit beta n=1 Tax=Altererythrobacter sp. TH136 TaxID=2067415 RepID=UPI0024A77A15|nr:glycine--tRNA ligase subunit beta [Altererythrobacter sp. TH136]
MSAADFLLELRCEEIPARMQKGARADLEKLFRAQMDAAGVPLGEITVWSTPRRLALIARGLLQATQAVSEETKGPRTTAPDQALEGFLRTTGLSKDQLTDRDGVWFAIVEKPGRAVREVLADAIPAIVRAFPWPKSMRWGAASLSTESPRWVRPLSGIVAILGEDLVECQVGEIASGYMTLGHRFHHSGPITIGGADDYQEKLRACHVIVDHAEREALVRELSRAAALAAGLTLIEDEGLVVENAGLTEWPVPLLGRFDEAFLDVPPEVIQLTARVNQKYFVCEDAAGKLANAFVCTANIEAADGGAAIVDGNRKVLAARLSDARFFWEQDRKTSLADHAKKLERITFHEKLGTVADKVERVAKLARWLVEEGIVKGADPEQAEQAARLAKADLVTEMVGEFPELQGLMGGYYARADGLPDAVANAIRDHYKPVGQGDGVPTAPVTVAVSLADKLDTLRSFFEVDEKPTGSKDPFALRRAALGIIRLVQDNQLRLPIAHGDLLDFFADRLKVQQREAGVRHDLIDAVFALGGEDDLVRLLARVHALQAFMATEDGANLLAGYKRAANILKKEDWHGSEGEIARTGEEDPLALVDDPDLAPVIAAKMAERRENALSYTPEPAEVALIQALDSAEPTASRAVEAEDFGAAMSALASLRAPIDAFFDSVTVNDPDAAKRAARLDLLARLRDAVHRVADFSRIEG